MQKSTGKQSEKSKLLQIKMPQSLHTALKLRSIATEKSMNQIINECLEKELKDELALADKIQQGNK